MCGVPPTPNIRARDSGLCGASSPIPTQGLEVVGCVVYPPTPNTRARGGGLCGAPPTPNTRARGGGLRGVPPYPKQGQRLMVAVTTPPPKSRVPKKGQSFDLFPY